MQVTTPSPDRLVLLYGQPRAIPWAIGIVFAIAAALFTGLGEADIVSCSGQSCQAIKASNWGSTVIDIPKGQLQATGVTPVPGPKGHTDYATTLTLQGSTPQVWTTWSSEEDAQEAAQKVQSTVNAGEAVEVDLKDTRGDGWGLALVFLVIGVVIALRMTLKVETTFDRASRQATRASTWPWTENVTKVAFAAIKGIETMTNKGSTHLDLVLKDGAGRYFLGTVPRWQVESTLQRVEGFVNSATETAG